VIDESSLRRIAMWPIAAGWLGMEDGGGGGEEGETNDATLRHLQ
jgi:hypothetical protein